MPSCNQEKPLPGFPRKEKFKSKEEVDSYFAGERIQCLLCGRWFKWISGMHLGHIHGISSDAYKEMFGLPWKRGLLGTLARKKKSKVTKRLRAEGKLTNASEVFRKCNCSPRRPHQPYEKDHAVKMALAVHGKIRKYHREDYDRILERMRNQKRLLKDVCGDPDMPSLSAWKNYVKRRPELKEQIHRINHSLSYSLQARTHDLSPQFSIECQRLRARGESVIFIAEALNVSTNLVIRVLKEASPDFHRLKPGIGALKWQLEDYEAIFDRMQDQQRTVMDLCKDPDLPSINTLNRFMKKNPNFENKIREIQHRLPYHLQTRTRIPSPRFTIDCQRLRAKGMSFSKIGRALGCPISTVTRVLRDNPDSNLPEHVNPGSKWLKKDYEAIFEKMRSRQKPLREVCKDKDLPSLFSWYIYKKKHPEIVERYLQVLWSLPIHVQMKTRTLSPKLLGRVQRMHSGGMNRREIADELGVNIYAVERFLKIIRKEKST